MLLFKVFPFPFLHKYFYILVSDDSYKAFLQDFSINFFTCPPCFVGNV